MIKHEELIAGLRKGKIANCYFFCGEEAYLKREAILILKDTLIRPGAEDFDYRVLYAEDSSAKEVISLAETYPLASKMRLMVVRDIDRFAESELKEIIKYLKRPASFTCLVLTSDKAKKETLNQGIYKAISALCETVIFWRLFDSQIPGWIKDKMSKEGKTIYPEAVQYLFAEVGNSLLDLSGEIEKLLIYTRNNKEVTLADVEQSIGRSRTDSIFDLLRAITRKDSRHSIEILAKLLESGEKPVRILARISERIRQIILAKELLEQKVLPSKIIEEVGLHPFFDKDFISQIQYFSMEELLSSFDNLVRADWEIKVGKKPAEFVLELLILNLCGENRPSTYSA